MVLNLEFIHDYCSPKEFVQITWIVLTGENNDQLWSTRDSFQIGNAQVGLSDSPSLLYFDLSSFSVLYSNRKHPTIIIMCNYGPSCRTTTNKVQAIHHNGNRVKRSGGFHKSIFHWITSLFKCRLASYVPALNFDWMDRRMQQNNHISQQ